MLAWRPTEDPEAHQLYMKGRYFWNKRNPENLKKAIEYFERAIAQDPAYALAFLQRMMRARPWPRPAKQWNSMRVCPKRTPPWPTRSS